MPKNVASLDAAREARSDVARLDQLIEDLERIEKLLGPIYDRLKLERLGWTQFRVGTLQSQIRNLLFDLEEIPQELGISAVSPSSVIDLEDIVESLNDRIAELLNVAAKLNVSGGEDVA